MKTVRFAVAALLAFLLAGCSVGPHYRTPETQAPARWAEEPRGGAKSAPMTATQWWKSLNDPELDRFIDRAVAANHDLRMATARLQEARALRRGTAWDFGPAVNSAASYRKQRLSENAQTFQGLELDSETYDAGFDAVWEIDIFGGKRRALEAAWAEVQASEADRQDVLLSVLSETARNYVELRSFQRRLDIARRAIESQKSSLDLTQARFRGGMTSELDVTQAQALLSGTQAQLPSLETAAKQTMYRLDVLTGKQPGTSVPELSKEAPVPSAPPEVPVGLPSDLLRRRPDVRRAERRLASVTARIGVEVAELFPKLSLFGSGGVQSLSSGDLFSSGSGTGSVGPTVSWRVLDFGRIKSRIEAAGSRADEALAAYEKTVLVAFEDAEGALVAYANEQERFRSLQQQVTAYERALALAKQRYSAGAADYLNVLDAQRSLYEAQDNLAQSERTVTTNLIALYKALGGGWEGFDRS